MASFTNVATLSYGGNQVSSNVVTGEIREVLTVSKTAVPAAYAVGDTITYVIYLINSGPAALTGLTVTDDGDLMELLTELGKARQEYDKVAAALKSARENGYGIVMPSVEELDLEDPEIVKQGGRYGVRMRASAPSIHMIRADIETTVSPIVGNEKQSEDMVNYLLQEFEGDTSKIWNSNIFGRSFHEIVGEDLQAKLKRMPAEAQVKLRQALERIINEGGGGLICIIL